MIKASKGGGRDGGAGAEGRRERGRNSIGHRDSGAGGFGGFAFV